MSKINKNKHLSKSVNAPKVVIPEIILNRKGFALLKNGHRSKLYNNLNRFFNPNKTSNYYKLMFLYPETYIPKNTNTKFYIDTMQFCLSEVLNDVVLELTLQKAHLDEIIPQIQQILKAEKNEKV